MADFHAELYLRLIGERMLSDRDRRHGPPRRPLIAEAAAALVAVGAIDASRAEGVLDDYSLAATLRDDPHFHRRTTTGSVRTPVRGETKPLGPRRVVPCAGTIGQPPATGKVRYVSLSEESTSVAVTLHAEPGMGWLRGAKGPTLTDDRGTTVVAPFSGSGFRDGMHGRLTAVRPLAPDTAWIELSGTRLQLDGQASGFAATLERLPEQDPAHQYLWQRIAEPDEFYEDGIEPVIDALVAAGVLSPSDPLLDDVRAVLEAWGDGGLHQSAGAGREVNAMPEPWHSLLARKDRRDGPEGSIVLGAVTPAFDGFSVAVLDLQSDGKGFKLDVEVAPGVGRGMPFDWSLRPRQLAWWAKDDLGNHYLGRRGNWSYTEGYGNGPILFGPPLDPRAARLALMPTAQTTRAVISFPLPWVSPYAATGGVRA